MVPYQAILTPAFLELNFLHLTNSLLGLVFFYSTFNLPFGVFVMRNTFSQIPAELEGVGPGRRRRDAHHAMAGPAAAGDTRHRHHRAVRIPVRLDRVPRSPS